MKQMGRYCNTKICNHEFSKYISQVPSMSAAEQIPHYSQGIKTREQIEVKRTKPSTLQEAMMVANRTESLFSRSYSSFGLQGSYNEKNPAENQRPCKLEI